MIDKGKYLKKMSEGIQKRNLERNVRESKTVRYNSGITSTKRSRGIDPGDLGLSDGDD